MTTVNHLFFQELFANSGPGLRVNLGPSRGLLLVKSETHRAFQWPNRTAVKISNFGGLKCTAIFSYGTVSALDAGELSQEILKGKNKSLTFLRVIPKKERPSRMKELD